MLIAIKLIVETFGQEPVSLKRITMICYAFKMYTGLEGDVNILDQIIGIY